MVATPAPSPEPPIDGDELIAILCRHLTPHGAAMAIDELMRKGRTESDVVSFVGNKAAGTHGVVFDGWGYDLTPLLHTAGLIPSKQNPIPGRF